MKLLTDEHIQGFVDDLSKKYNVSIGTLMTWYHKYNRPDLYPNQGQKRGKPKEKNLTKEDSVHLTLYPQSKENKDIELISTMDSVISICSSVKTLREEAGIRNRQPLNTLTIASPKSDNLKAYTEIISTECNVKSVEFTTDIDKYAKKLLYIYTPIVGKRLGRALAEIQKAAKLNEYTISHLCITLCFK